MKTTTPILSLILAAASTAFAQQPAQSVEATSVTPSGAVTLEVKQPTQSVEATSVAPSGEATPEVTSDRKWVTENKWVTEVTSDRKGGLTELSLTLADGVGDLILFNDGPGGYLGVSSSPLPREMAAQLPVQENTGLMLDAVLEGSPAAKAGLQKGDVLVKLDEQILIHSRQFAVLVGSHKEGDSVKLSYIRKGQPMEATAVIGKREAEQVSYSDPIRTNMPIQSFTRLIEAAHSGRVYDRSEKVSESATAGQAAPAPDNAQLLKELKELRTVLDALQQQLK